MVLVMQDNRLCILRLLMIMMTLYNSYPFTLIQ